MLKETAFSTKGFIIWGVCVLFFLYEFFLHASFGTFQHPLMQDLQISSFQYSLLSTTFFVVLYGGMQIPAGLLIDHFGLKKILLLGATICALSSFGLAYSSTFLQASMARIFMGIGASAGFLSVLISVHDWMPHRHNAFFIGLSQFIGTIGPMLGAGPLEDLMATAHIPWQTIFKMLGVIGFLIVALIAVLVENSHAEAERYVILKRPQRMTASIAQLFSNRQAWYIALFSASIYFSIEYLSENEGRMFLGLKGFSLNFSSYMLTLSWIGYAIGCPLLGFLSDYFERRKQVLRFAAVCSIFSILTIVFSDNKTLLIIAFFLLGIAAGGQSIGFAIIAEQFKESFVIMGLALNNTMITFFAAVNAPLIGWILDDVKHRANFGAQDYYGAFSILIVMSLVALIFAFIFIRETFCKSVADFTRLKTNGVRL